MGKPGLESGGDPPAVFVVSELFPPDIGGSAVLLHEIYRRMRDHRVAVLADARPDGPPARTCDPTLDVTRRPLATRAWGLADLRGTGHHLAVAAAIRARTSRNGSVVHCGRALPEGVAAWLSRRLFCGARYICWSHGEDVSVALTSRELTWVMRRVYHGAAAVIANSRHTRQSLLDLGIPSDRVHVVYPGVDPNRFSPLVDGRAVRRRYLGEGDTMLLTVGRLQRRKGHDLVIFALAEIADSTPGLRYVIAGDGEERRRLERLVAERGLTRCVTFAGAVSDGELPAYFAACDVFLMPNRREGADIEGFGIAFLEAAASGKPAIGGTTGGAPEAVEDGRTGVLVSGTDAHELAGAIVRLAGDPDARRRLGHAGRSRVLERFTWDRAAAEVTAIHRSACRRRVGLPARWRA